MPRSEICIIGAGPKALSLVAKNYVLKQLGFEVPKITILEKTSIAAHWTGNSGFTNGKLPLGTSPEKDVGFPYSSFCWGSFYNPLVNQRMQEFSWQNFLVSKLVYADWVDRGKPAPNHKKWAEYLDWVYKRSGKDVEIIFSELQNVELDENKWKLRHRDKTGKTSELSVDGLVMTGPGKLKLPFSLPNDDRVLTVQKFWTQSKKYTSFEGARFAVVGTGENAASVAVTLGQSESNLKIDIISPVAMNYSRGESYVENHVYTDPFQGNWLQLTCENRRDFIYRTDRGVFSVVTKQMLDQMESIHIIPGRLTQVEIDSLKQLLLTVEYDKETEKRSYDFVIVATGFDHLGFLRDMLSKKTQNTITEKLGLSDLSEHTIEENIEEDISLKGLTPKLHLPMLSAMSQGPGFANLSCLGRLSDQILSSYVTQSI